MSRIARRGERPLIGLVLLLALSGCDRLFGYAAGQGAGDGPVRLEGPLPGEGPPPRRDSRPATDGLVASGWSASFGGDQRDSGQALAVDAQGNIYLAGYFSGSINFGGTTLVSNGQTDLFLASFTAGGVHRWSRRDGGSANDEALGLALDRQGHLYLTGRFQNQIQFHQDVLDEAGMSDILLASFDSEGNYRWSKRFGGSEFEVGTQVACDAEDNIYITGYLKSGGVSFGGAPVGNPSGSDIFAASFTGGGAHRWSKRFGGAGDDHGRSVAVAGGLAFLAGDFSSASVAFDKHSISSVGTLADIFLVACDSVTGEVAWARPYGGDGPHGASAVAAAAGALRLTGHFTQAVSFGGPLLTSAGAFDLFVAAISPAGEHLWSKAMGGIGADRGAAVAIDAARHTFVLGHFGTPTASAGSFQLKSAGGDDLLIAELDPFGSVVWARSLGGPGTDRGLAIALGADGALLVTGEFLGSSIDLGGDLLASQGSWDLFLGQIRRGSD